jgi:putative transcriptional regulator
MEYRSRVMIHFRLGALMEERGLSLARLARRSDVSLNAVRNMRNGELKEVDLSVLDKLCRFLQVGVGDLLVYVPDEEAQASSELPTHEG